MSLTLITNPPTSLTVDTDWTTFVSREGVSQIGTGLSIPIFRLTNWDSGTSRPLVEIGSIIEVGGSLYQADADTAIVDDASISDGLCFIKLVPDTLTVIPTLTNDTPPTFNAEKAGWYDGDEKWLPFVLTRAGSGSSFVSKGEYVDQNKNVIRYIDGGTYMSGATQVGGALTVGAGGIFGGNVSITGDATASGSLFFNGEYKTRVETFEFDADMSAYATYYTATNGGFAMVIMEDVSPSGYGSFQDHVSFYPLHKPISGVTNNDTNVGSLYRYQFSASQNVALYCQSSGNELQFRFILDVGSFSATARVLIFERV